LPDKQICAAQLTDAAGVLFREPQFRVCGD